MLYRTAFYYVTHHTRENGEDAADGSWSGRKGAAGRAASALAIASRRVWTMDRQTQRSFYTGARRCSGLRALSVGPFPRSGHTASSFPPRLLISPSSSPADIPVAVTLESHIGQSARWVWPLNSIFCLLSSQNKFDHDICLASGL